MKAVECYFFCVVNLKRNYYELFASHKYSIGAQAPISTLKKKDNVESEKFKLFCRERNLEPQGIT